MVKIVAVADTHGEHDRLDIPMGDLLVHAGDWTMMGSKKKIKAFLQWVNSLPHQHKVIIAGNHDLDMDPTTPMYGDLKMKDLIDSFPSIHYLCDSGVTLQVGEPSQQIKIWGSPFTPTFQDWVFQYDVGERSWSDIPNDTDILITHGPPHGILDSINEKSGGGCPALRERVETIKPKVHIFGHLHEDGGSTMLYDGTLFVNAAIGYYDEWFPEEIPQAVTVHIT